MQLPASPNCAVPVKHVLLLGVDSHIHAINHSIKVGHGGKGGCAVLFAQLLGEVSIHCPGPSVYYSHA